MDVVIRVVVGDEVMDFFVKYMIIDWMVFF